MTKSWSIFGIVTTLIFTALFAYGLSIPEVRTHFTTTDISTTIVGVLAMGYFLIKSLMLGPSFVGSQKALIIFAKAGLVAVFIIDLYIIYILWF